MVVLMVILFWVFICYLLAGWFLTFEDVHNEFKNGGKWLLKKTVPNSFPTERMAERATLVVKRMEKINFQCSPEIHMISREREHDEITTGTLSLESILSDTCSAISSNLTRIQGGESMGEQRERFKAILDDLERLLDITPARGMGREKRTTIKWDYEMPFSRDALRMFLEHVEAVKAPLDELTKELEGFHREKQHKKELEILSQLRAVQLSSAVNQHRGLPSLSMEQIPEPHRAAYEKAWVRANTLPLIESERVKRILADSAEAQELAREATENGEVSFDGHSPEEMVSSILESNARRLNSTLEQASRGGSAVDRLRTLEMFTEERSRS